MNPIYSLIELRQIHHYYHHFSTIMVLLVYGYLVYFIVATLTITFLYLLSCKAISHTRIGALDLFPRWCKYLVYVELYQRLIELERTFILPLAPRWVRHSYLSKRLHTIPYTCGISAGQRSSRSSRAPWYRPRQAPLHRRWGARAESNSTGQRGAEKGDKNCAPELWRDLELRRSSHYTLAPRERSYISWGAVAVWNSG
jgi:hypothetical protein